MSKSHERRINLPPLRRLLVYQKLRQRIIYETRLAGFRLRSVGAGDMSQCNLIEIRSDCSRGGKKRGQVWIHFAGEGKVSRERRLLKKAAAAAALWIIFIIPEDTGYMLRITCRYSCCSCWIMQFAHHRLLFTVNVRFYFYLWILKTCVRTRQLSFVRMCRDAHLCWVKAKPIKLNTSEPLLFRQFFSCGQ